MKRLFVCNWRIMILALALLYGCREGHDHGSGRSNSHVHKPPHGGKLVELGDHAFNLELLLDDEAGTLGVYILGAHAEKHIRIEMESLKLSLSAGSDSQELKLKAVANELTNETVGDSSYFSGQSDWLKGKHDVIGMMHSVEIRGMSFKEVSFDLSGHHGHAH
uniref:Uncharacterized protein n=1 Tax=uncultured verrucomicrobium HF0500_27H16 TaxID=723600 RepID=E7C5J5_9BACT|nr:hypothetical protein [uncultured verrucomicrobium HF0500_27H16]